MLNINEFRVTPDGKALIIDIQVELSDYYTHGFIESVILSTSSGSEDKSYVEEWNRLIQLALTDLRETTHLRISLDIDAIGNEVIFYLNVFGNSDNIEGWNNLPCYLKVALVNAYTYNKYPIYKNIMCLTKELDKDCNVPMSFIDYMLRLKTLEAALNTADITKANEYWKQLIKDFKKMTPKQCGCNG